MSKRTYTLELTAEEVARLGEIYPMISGAIGQRVHKLCEQARADATADELRLPWRIAETVDPGWCVVCADKPERPRTAAAAKLMSAAPELLEAVRAVEWAFQAVRGQQYPARQLDALNRAERLIERALRKVATGVPEDSDK